MNKADFIARRQELNEKLFEAMINNSEMIEEIREEIKKEIRELYEFAVDKGSQKEKNFLQIYWASFMTLLIGYSGSWLAVIIIETYRLNVG